MKSSTSTGRFQPLETISTPQIHHLSVLSHLTCLFHLYPTRLTLLNRREDADEIIQLLPISAKIKAIESDRLPYLCRLAIVAHSFGHPSVSTAYDRAMSSMQACLTLAPTLDIQHSQLVVMMGDTVKSLPFDYASH